MDRSQYQITTARDQSIERAVENRCPAGKGRKYVPPQSPVNCRTTNATSFLGRGLTIFVVHGSLIATPDSLTDTD